LSAKIVAPDELPLDNIGNTVIEVVEEVPFLIVSDSESKNSVETDTGCLLAALGHADDTESGGWRSIFQPTIVESPDLQCEELSQYRSVVLADSGVLSGEIYKCLYDYVTEGGGVWIVLGENIDPADFNTLVFREGKGLSPLELGEIVDNSSEPEENEFLRPPEPGHPATRN